MTIDVHAHCVPAELIEFLRLEGSALGVELSEDGKGVTALLDGRRTAGPIRADLIDVDLRLETMDRTGVAVQMLSSWVDLTGYELDPEAGAKHARRFNETMAAEAAAHPDRFLVLATVPLQDGGLAAAELEYAVKHLGAVGVEIATTVDGVALADAGLDPFWAKAEELRAIVLLHPHQPLPGIDLSAKLLHNAVGRPLESTIAFAKLIVAGVLDRYPDLRVCIVHGGGALPFQIGRLDHAYRALPHVVATDMESAPIDLLKRVYCDTVLFNPLAIRYLIDFLGIDHVVLGSDYPFPMGDLDPVTSVNAVPGLSDDDRALIFEGNVNRLLAEVRRD